jgi:hypothetical protein
MFDLEQPPQPDSANYRRCEARRIAIVRGHFHIREFPQLRIDHAIWTLANQNFAGVREYKRGAAACERG